jgi:hypothetical protein
MKKLLNKKNITLLLVLGIIMIASPAYAADPKIVSGTKSLFTAASGWVTGLIPVAAGVGLAFCKFKQVSSDNDPSVVAHYNKQMKTIIISSAIGMTASGTITAVLAFYQ